MSCTARTPAALACRTPATQTWQRVWEWIARAVCASWFFVQRREDRREVAGAGGCLRRLVTSPWVGFLLGDMVCFWEKGPVSGLLYWAGVLLYPARSNHTVIAFRSLIDDSPSPPPKILLHSAHTHTWYGYSTTGPPLASIIRFNTVLSKNLSPNQTVLKILY